jgi:hypothetical protein
VLATLLAMSSDPVAAAIASARIPHNEPSSLHSDALPHSGASAGPSRLRSSSISSASSSSSSAGPIVYDSKATLPRVTPPRRKSAAGLSSPSDTRGSLDSVGFGYEQHLLPLSMSARIDDDADDDMAQYASARTRISYGDREGDTVEGGRSPRREERRMGLVDGECARDAAQADAVAVLGTYSGARGAQRSAAHIVPERAKSGLHGQRPSGHAAGVLATSVLCSIEGGQPAPC